ncbi:MAG TPA: hypothetical protein DCE42_26175 [Myxococcales bacterium]|nr:hypothetical protein [Deltaproteobacteria bacterium]HAA58277.1 hypothetical protein [Myxococcales bacterium]|tara:strand:+ start:17031 stop:17483 length:453 start_codon:yes stop_codon:yes gene_type:complete
MKAQRTYRLEQATSKDIPALVQLMGDAVPDCAPQTVWDIPWNWSSYRVIRDPEGEIIAAGSMQEVDSQNVELRGIVVKSSQRGSGIATYLLKQLMEHVQEQQQTPMCITGKPGFFEQLGFQYAPHLRKAEWARERPDRRPSQRIPMFFAR